MIAVNNSKNGILAVIRYELSRLLSKKLLLLLAFFYPVFALIYFLCLFSTGSITGMPVAVVDQDASKISRQVIQSISASPSISVTERYTEFSSAKESLLNGNIYAVVVIPYRFESDALGGKQPAIILYTNGQFMSVASTINQGLSKTLTGINGNQIVNNVVGQTGVSSVIATKQLTAIPVGGHALFNPTLNYNFSLGNGLFPTILQVMIMLMAGSCILNDVLDSRAKEKGLKLVNGNMFIYIFAKLLPYFLLYLFYLLIFDFILIFQKGMPINGTWGILFLGHMLFIIAALLAGTLVALIVASPLKMISSCSVFASPAFGFSGLVYPRFGMNVFSYYWGSILPTTWYLEIRLDQTLRNTGTGYSVDALMALCIIIFVLTCAIAVVAKIKKFGVVDA